MLSFLNDFLAPVLFISYLGYGIFGIKFEIHLDANFQQNIIKFNSEELMVKFNSVEV